MIKTIKMKNFGKIKDLTIDCDHKNVYIVGQNGSGKTTILQAISLALTGKVAKGLTNDLFVGPYDKDFTIILELDDGTKIGRTSKGAKLQLSTGAVFKKVKDVYDHLSFDPALLFNLSYVRQGEIADLFMAGNGKGVVDKLSSLIIDSKRMGEGNTELNRIIKMLESDLNHYEETKKQNEEYLKSVDVDELKSEIEKYTKLQDELIGMSRYSEADINRFYNLHKVHDSLKDNLVRYKSDVDYCKNQYSAVVKPTMSVSDLKDKQMQYVRYQEDMEDIDEIKKRIEAYNDAMKFVDDMDEYINTKFYRINYTENELNDIRDTKDLMLSCLTTVNHFDSVDEAVSFAHKYKDMDEVDAQILLENKKKHDYLVNRLSPYKEIVKHVRGIKANNPNISSMEAIRNVVEDYAKAIETICNRYSDNVPVKVTDKEINDLDSSWRKYNDAEAQLKKAIRVYNNLLQEYSDSEAAIKNIPDKDTLDRLKNSQEMLAQYGVILLKYQESLDMYNQAVLANKDIVKNVEETKSKLDRALHWKSIFGDTPNRMRAVLFNPVVAVLNKEFYELFSFSGLGEINIDWNKVNITVGEKKFEQLSGAQMVAVGLSLRLALLKVMGECVPIMLVDEPTTFLDDDRKNDIQKLLSHMSSVSQLFVSTHDDNIISPNSVVINLNK